MKVLETASVLASFGAPIVVDVEVALEERAGRGGPCRFNRCRSCNLDKADDVRVLITVMMAMATH